MNEALPRFAPRGHTTGVKEESDQVSAVPLVKRRGEGRIPGRQKRKNRLQVRRLRHALNDRCGQKLPVILRDAVRRDRRHLEREIRAVFRRAARAAATVTMAATVGNACFSVRQVPRSRQESGLPENQRNTEQRGKPFLHSGGTIDHLSHSSMPVCVAKSSRRKAAALTTQTLRRKIDRLNDTSLTK